MFFQGTGEGHGEQVGHQHKKVEGGSKILKSSSELRSAIEELGHNRLSEHGFLDEMPSGKGKWLEQVQSSVIDAGGAAIAYIEEGKVMGFVMADPEGVITQFRSAPGKESATLEKALRELKDKGFDHPKVRMTMRSEEIRHMFEHADFRKVEQTEDGKLVMEKE